MKVQIENIGPFEKKLIFEIPPDIVNQELDTTYRNLNRTVKLKGFRPGKVPRSILERYYKAQVEEEVLSKLVNDSFGKAVKDHHLLPVSPPTLLERTFEAGKELKYTLTVEVKPEIEVEGYRGLEIPREKVLVSDEEVEAQLRGLQENHAQMKPLDAERPIQEKDYALVDLSATLDGKPLKEWQANDHLVEVGSGTLVGELDRKLVGLRVNQEVDIPLRLPADYPKKELAGREIIVHVRVKELKEKILPKLDDEFAKDVGNFNSLEELRNQIRRTLAEQKQARADQAAKERLLDRLIEKHPFAIPKGWVERRVEAMVQRTRARLAGQGLKLEDTEIDGQKLRESFRATAEREIRSSLILEKIAEKEKIQVDEAEIDLRLNQMAAQWKQRVETLRALYEKEGWMEDLRSQLLEEKTLDFLLRESKGIEVDRQLEAKTKEEKSKE